MRHVYGARALLKSLENSWTTWNLAQVAQHANWKFQRVSCTGNIMIFKITLSETKLIWKYSIHWTYLSVVMTGGITDIAMLLQNKKHILTWLDDCIDG